MIILFSQSSWRCLLASEVVHLMCLVPIYFESMQTSEGTMKLFTILLDLTFLNRINEDDRYCNKGIKCICSH